MAAQVDHDPGDIAEEGDGDGGTDEREERLDYAQADHIVSALWPITWRKHVLVPTAFKSGRKPIHTNGDSPMMLPRAQTACSHTFW